jgi:DNA replication initiation complex subunit (GINS family)
VASFDSSAKRIEELVAEEDLAVGDLLNACDDYCDAVAGAEPERAEDAQRARNRAKTRLATVHQRLTSAVTELAG